jgi:hypothetical protein
MRGAAPHVVAVVAPAMVVGHQPGVGFALELTDRGEVTAVEGRAPALFLCEPRPTSTRMTALR